MTFPLTLPLSQPSHNLLLFIAKAHELLTEQTFVLLGHPLEKEHESKEEEDVDQSQYEHIRLKLRRHHKNLAIPALEVDCLLNNLKAAISPLEASLLLDLLSVITNEAGPKKNPVGGGVPGGGKGKEKSSEPGSERGKKEKEVNKTEAAKSDKKQTSAAVIKYKVNDKGITEVIETESGNMIESFVSDDEMSAFSDTSSDDEDDSLEDKPSSDSDSDDIFAYKKKRNIEATPPSAKPPELATTPTGARVTAPTADSVDFRFHALVETGSITLVYDPNSVAPVFKSTEFAQPGRDEGILPSPVRPQHCLRYLTR